MADQKITNAMDVNADIIISTDISCLMHIQGFSTNNHRNVKTMHLADVLANGW